MLHQDNSTSEHTREVLEGRDLEFYGIDPNSPVPDETREMGVYVPETLNPLSHEQTQVAKQIVGNAHTIDDHGIPLYTAVREYVMGCVGVNG